VFVIDPADALAPEGVGRYLKTLEEPPASTTFLLVTSRPDRLPDAVKSRCQRVRFAPPSEADLAARLVGRPGEGRGVPPERARRIARLSGASHARAARFLALGIDEVVDAIVAAGRGPVPAAATAADRALRTLEHRAAAATEGAADGAGAGEALRQALDDLFHALLATARDRAAEADLGHGAARGPLDDASPEEAAAALASWGRLAALVRRNLSPSSLMIQAVAAARPPTAPGVRP
jgi:DNA polymerase-3 subunit delta'